MSEYELQEPTFELSCRGELTVTLSDDNFTLFGFHAKINKEIKHPETGTIHKESHRISEDGQKKWTVHIRNTALRQGDTVYYWINVMRHRTEYHKTGRWVVPTTVTEFYPEPTVYAFLSRTALESIYKKNYTNIEAGESSSPPEEFEDDETI